ncbi:hypothetical protein MYX75_01025 [Acidobacteria bacterium AH-259-A15]|nr:hypothetical protein [Acidobacteria bacterium AH-259-A15]
MALLTTTQITDHFDTDLPTAAIQRLLDDAEKEIIRLFGGHTSQVDNLLIVGTLTKEEQSRDLPGKYIFPTRPIKTVTSIVETVSDTDTTLASDDYKLFHGGRQIKRLNDGTNPRTIWGSRVKVTYVPVDDQDQRKRVQLDLVKLAIQFDGLANSKVGSVALVIGEYEGQRQQILSRLLPALALV